MNKKINIGFLLCSLLLAGLFADAQTEDGSVYQTDTLLIRKNIELIGIPLVFYSPETQFGFGGGGQIFFHNQLNIYNSRLSSVLATVMYTTKKQLMIDVAPKIYFLNGEISLDGLFRYRIFPNNFWGIGNETSENDLEVYNMKTNLLQAALLFRIPPSLSFGVEYMVEDDDMLDVEENGKLAGDSITGANGARLTGLSFIFNLDSRTNDYSPKRGTYFKLKAGFSSQVMGATASYNKYIFDFRKYFPLTYNSVLAGQAYFENTFGDIPFQAMALLGGPDRMRGYYKGRFMDKHTYAVQAEYRFWMSMRIIVAAFAAIGEVSSNPLTVLDFPKFSFGGGIRYQPLRNTPTYIRLDVGFGQDGQSGVYFGVNEAF